MKLVGMQGKFLEGGVMSASQNVINFQHTDFSNENITRELKSW